MDSSPTDTDLVREQAALPYENHVYESIKTACSYRVGPMNHSFQRMPNGRFAGIKMASLKIGSRSHTMFSHALDAGTGAMR